MDPMPTKGNDFFDEDMDIINQLSGNSNLNASKLIK
jgi:hypothetical protein